MRSYTPATMQIGVTNSTAIAAMSIGLAPGSLSEAVCASAFFQCQIFIHCAKREHRDEAHPRAIPNKLIEPCHTEQPFNTQPRSCEPDAVPSQILVFSDRTRSGPHSCKSDERESSQHPKLSTLRDCQGSTAVFERLLG